uniref:lipid IVA 3-deoxy-D-manno-octulosonic acid transferase n=1 Tax=Anthurium amnicola TaxID=1678845 RepID=A0A1D1ZIX7_9ARAE
MSAANGWRRCGSAAFALYRAAMYAACPLVYLLVRWRRLRGLEHPVRWRERLGEPSSPRPPPGTPLIWFHAVSLGEGLAAVPVIRHCVQQRPDIAVLMTTTTASAFEVIKDRLPNCVIHQFAPLDTSAAVNNFLGYWNPYAIFLMESELWPNLILSAAEKGIALALLNARISIRSFKLWSEPLARSLISLMLSKFSLIAPLSTIEGIRFQLLQAPPFIINFAGDLKYAVGDFDVPEKELILLEDLKLQVANRPVWMASSIHNGEEEVVLEVHKEIMKKYPNIVTIIVPRHPLHGRQIALALQQQGICTVLRSSFERISPSTAIYIVDTLGELRTLYRVTPIAVVGGSFLPELAGHNLAEAAAAACAVLTGPHVGHFSHMIREMLRLEHLSVWQVAGKQELSEALDNLLGDTRTLEARRTAAKEAFSALSTGIVRNVWELITVNVLKESSQKPG